LSQIRHFVNSSYL